jgi:hypothetical protein
MKTTSLLIVLVCVSILAGYPASGQDTDKITSNIEFVNVPVDKVLDVYKTFTKSELVVASDVRRATHGITVHAAGVFPRETVREMIERSLLKQAGIVITHLDDKRVSVTYNDKLELEP